MKYVASAWKYRQYKTQKAKVKNTLCAIVAIIFDSVQLKMHIKTHTSFQAQARNNANPEI